MNSKNESRIKIPKELLPSEWQKSYLLDLMLSDGRIIAGVFIHPNGEIWGQCEPLRGEPAPLRDTFNPKEIVAIKLCGGWREFAVLRHFFPHKWRKIRQVDKYEN